MKNNTSYIKRTPYWSIHDTCDSKTSITWSLHVLEISINGDLTENLMIDAGMYNGSWEVIAQNNNLSIEPSSIKSAILTHNHADHNGRMPTVVGKWYDGNIFLTEHSRYAFPDIMEDSLFVQMKEIEKRKSLRANFWWKLQQAFASKDKNPQQIKLLEQYPIKQNSDIKIILDERFWALEPLFSQEDLDKTYSQLVSHPYHNDNNTNKFPVFPNSDLVHARFLDAWHIFWSSMILLEISKKNSKKIFNVLRWWDLWRFWNRIYWNSPSMWNIKKPLDMIFLESTYWGRNHPEMLEELNKKYATINQVHARWWVVLQNLFTQDRFQLDILYDLDAIENWTLSDDTMIIADSTLAKKLAITMSINDPIYKKILSHPNVKWVEKEQAEALLLKKPINHIFKMSWWMMQGWTVMKLIKYFDKNNKDVKVEHKDIAHKGMVILTWYTPEYTLWWKIKNDTNSYNSASFNFSSHIDHNGIIDFVTNKNWESGVSLRDDAKICLMHGEIWNMFKIKESLMQEWFNKKNIIIPVSNWNSFTFPIK